MLRLAGAAFAVVMVTLLALALRPGGEPELPDARIRLGDAQVTLHPRSDPEAHWGFEAPRASFDPDSGETVLTSVEDGERRVGDEVDFTLRSDRLVIDRNDDIRAEEMSVHLVEDDLDVAMQGTPERQVLVDQDAGRFEVPHIELSGEDFGRATYENMRVDFDFTDFQAGGPDTIGYSEFLLEERSEDAP